jgi:hypothetical protein
VKLVGVAAGGGETVAEAVTDAAGGVAAGVGAAELNSDGAVNGLLHCGQVVVLPARSSAMLIGSEQLGQNTRMPAPLVGHALR